jgi:hypothetical protein
MPYSPTYLLTNLLTHLHLPSYSLTYLLTYAPFNPFNIFTYKL